MMVTVRVISCLLMPSVCVCPGVPDRPLVLSFSRLDLVFLWDLLHVLSPEVVQQGGRVGWGRCGYFFFID